MKNIILHLRIPFSLFLMPVYWFALSQSEHKHGMLAIGIFILLHLLIYPASNAYNSYYDKDEGAIGGLEKPPPVSKELYYVAWGLDVLAIIMAFALSGYVLALALLIYSTISKAYSYDKIRLKKYPFISWLTVGFFQGFFIYMTIIQALDSIPLADLMQTKYLFPALLSTVNLLGFYPMTQIYQHEEDAKRGDLTMSRVLGIRGTFIFTASIFMIVTIGFYFFLVDKTIFHLPAFGFYLLVMSPVLVFFNWWFFKVLKDENRANFNHTMQLNMLGSVCLNIFFMALLFFK